MIEYIFRPIDKWPREFTRERKRHAPFHTVKTVRNDSGGSWKQRADLPFERVVRDLALEAERHGAKLVVVQLALKGSEIRRDGLPYATAKPAHPGVIVAFEGKYGPVKMPCDAFMEWKDNLRAISVTLEHLRGVDRYGVSTMGEQYRGWTALPPAPDAARGLTIDEAAAILNEFAPFVTPEWIRGDREAFKTAQRAARIKAHPDTGGSNEAFKRVEEAAEVLARLHGDSSGDSRS